MTWILGGASDLDNVIYRRLSTTEEEIWSERLVA